jgi:NAD(P) transhydrogenase subunit alpha
MAAEAGAAEKPPVPTAAELAEQARRKQQRLYAWFGVAAVLVGLAITFSPVSFLGYFTVFILAVFVGFYVITNVSASLHTPLMAQTNAISGIILVGALLQLGSTNVLVVILAFVAATVASINIFGGFLVAGRMISMFRKDA